MSLSVIIYRSLLCIVNRTEVAQCLESSLNGLSVSSFAFSKCRKQGLLVFTVGLRKGMNDHQSSLTLGYIRTCWFSKDIGIGQYINQVIHKLEAESYCKTPICHTIDCFLVSTCHSCTNLCTCEEHDSGLSFNHLNVVVFGYCEFIFKLNIHLLTFTNASNHPSNSVDQWSHIVCLKPFSLY